jgi:hypothetical protein
MAGPDLPGLEGFEAGIRTAMQLGLAVNPTRRPVFVLPAAPDAGEDSRGLPWSVTGAMAEATNEVTDLKCAVEFKAPGSDLTDGGGVIAQTATIIVTLLQAEWNQVRTAESVRVSGTNYRRWLDAPDLALGTHGVYQLYFQAGDVL